MSNRAALLWGSGSAVTIGAITGSLFGIDALIQLYGYISLAFVAVSIALSGVLLSGDRLRANFSAEYAEDRERRNRFIGKLLLFALPYALVVILLYFLD